MKSFRLNQISLGFLLLGLAVFVTGCTTSANTSNRYFGEVEPPRENVLRYISGSEIETLDPQVSSGQPEARVYMALFDGLVEYNPKTMEPIPALAERWETSPGVDEFIFHLRKNARWSDGKPITAHDVVYSFRRGFEPELLSRTAYLGYYIKYAEPLNSHSVFVKKNGEFLLAKDFAKEGEAGQQKAEEYKPFGPETEFNKFIKSPTRLVLKGDEKERAKQLEKDPGLKAAVEGAEFVPVKGTDLGIEAIDDYTVRLSLEQPAPFFLGLLAHQFFRVIPQHVIEKHGRNWTNPANYVTSGPFKLKRYDPYHQLIVEKDPMYWDAATVKLDGIEFYPLEEQTTMLNLYKAGEVDAIYNHTVPSSWVQEVRQYKDEYMDHPEVAIEYQTINIRKPPMDNVKVRQAFSRAIDRDAMAKFRKTVKPLHNFTPEGIFPAYEAARKRVSEQLRQERGAAPEEWENRYKFSPEKACQLISEAGYKVIKTEGGRCRVENFPVEKVNITYNTTESNKAVAEFVQAQWKQNLGITVPLKNMEWKTFLVHRNNLEYEGLARAGWVGDYMDPFAFLSLHYGVKNEGATGWHDPKYDALLDEANATLDETKRYELLARAEFYMLDQQIVLPFVTQATNWIKKPYVKGLYPNPGTLHPWKFVYIERNSSEWDANVENIMK